MTSADQDYESQLRTEFRDQAQDRLASLNTTLAALRDGADFAGLQPALSRDVQNLKGLMAGYGYPVIALVVQRLETYLAGLQELSTRAIGDLQLHADRIADLIERTEQPEPAAAAQLLQALPVRFDFDVADIVVKRIEIMVVTPTRVVAKLVSGELAACGYRPIVVHDPLEALAQAVRVPPGLIMASVVMEPVNGVELIMALRQLTVTRALPAAVLTSMDADKKPLHVLPPDVAIIQTGNGFGADFALATARFNLG